MRRQPARSTTTPHGAQPATTGYLETTLASFLDELASSRPVPGGGAAAFRQVLATFDMSREPDPEPRRRAIRFCGTRKPDSDRDQGLCSIG